VTQEGGRKSIVDRIADGLSVLGCTIDGCGCFLPCLLLTPIAAWMLA
jgi:hypothetical protein